MIISAVTSGQGKTTFTLGLISALVKRGLSVQPFKVGPDFIDPLFHNVATNGTGKSYNLMPRLYSNEFLKDYYAYRVNFSNKHNNSTTFVRSFATSNMESINSPQTEYSITEHFPKTVYSTNEHFPETVYSITDHYPKTVYSITEHDPKSVYSITEGVMGYFDGAGFGSTEASTFEISKLTNQKTLLLYNAKSHSTTMLASLKGLLSFRDSKETPNSNIQGIILTNIDSYALYKELSTMIENNLELKVYGYFPSDDRLSIPSRPLGLITPQEHQSIENLIEIASENIEKYVHVDKILNDFFPESLNNIEIDNLLNPLALKKYNLSVFYGKKVAISYDEALFFLYQDNIDFFTNLGCEVVFFSPLKDPLPSCDLIYLCGGYPERYEENLKANKSLINSLKNNDTPIFAEGGGLMYLCENISGILSIKYEMTDRLQNFGYCKGYHSKLERSVLMHEFHKSKIVETNFDNFDGEKVSKELKVTKNQKQWECGYSLYKDQNLRIYATYGHSHFYGNFDYFVTLFAELLDCFTKFNI